MGAAEAARARFEYMAQGAGVPFGTIPLGQLGEWIEATEGERLLAHHAVDMAWLRVETAVAATVEQQRNPEVIVPFESAALLDAAEDSFEEVGAQPANDLILRSRAISATGGIGLYRSVVKALAVGEEGTETTPIDTLASYEKQIEAAELLMHAAARRGRTMPVHDLHLQAVLVVLNAESSTTEIVGLPVPSRLREEGDERSVDLMLWDISNNKKVGGMYLARVAVHESAVVGGHLVFHAGLLKNDAYPSETKQGTLQASIEQYHRRSMRRQPERVRHLYGVVEAHARHYIHQVAGLEALSFETDPINGLVEARQWYHDLSPLRSLTERDAPALEQCINPYENAYVAGELSSEDAMTLAWLRMEMGSISHQPEEALHAEDIFETVEQRTEGQQDWTHWSQALVGGITARLHAGLYSERPSGEVVAEYREDLEQAIVRLQLGLAEPGIQESRHGPAVYELLDRLKACYAISAGGEQEHLGVLASPRQQTQPDSPINTDILVIPLIDDTYRLQAAGRLRLKSVPLPESLDRGVATADPAPLWGTWRMGEGGMKASSSGQVETAFAYLLKTVEPVLFV